MNDTPLLVLQHCLSYLKKHHANDDGGVHINLIARLKDQIEKLEAEQKCSTPN